MIIINNAQIIINQVLVFYLMIFVGVYAGKIKILNETTNFALSRLLLNITLPFFIISSFNYQFSSDTLKNMLIILAFGIIIHPICYFVGLLIYRKYVSSTKSILVFSLIFTNCGYMAYPILESIYGKIYGSIFLAPFNIYLWTIGILLFKKEKLQSKYLILNPGIIAVFIGVIIFSFSIKLPFFLDKSITVIGQMTTPLSMIIIGGIISQMNVSQMLKNKLIYINSIIRLIVIPLLIFLILKIFDLDSTVYGICVLIVSMPVAVTLPIFAKRYDGDSQLASTSIFISTLISIITIPSFVLLLTL